MFVHDFPGDHQTQPRPLASLGAEETLKDFASGFRVHATAVVHHIQANKASRSCFGHAVDDINHLPFLPVIEAYKDLHAWTEIVPFSALGPMMSSSPLAIR